MPGKKKSINSAVKCFRLVTPDSDPVAQGETVVVPPEDDPAGMSCLLLSVFFWYSFPSDDQSCIKMNLTIHKQIITLIEESGTVGMTLNVCSSFFA